MDSLFWFMLTLVGLMMFLTIGLFFALVFSRYQFRILSRQVASCITFAIQWSEDCDNSMKRNQVTEEFRRSVEK